LLLAGGEDEITGEQPERNDRDEKQQREDRAEPDPADRLPRSHV
jgi:hypothetical protein